MINNVNASPSSRFFCYSTQESFHPDAEQSQGIQIGSCRSNFLPDNESWRCCIRTSLMYSCVEGVLEKGEVDNNDGTFRR